MRVSQHILQLFVATVITSVAATAPAEFDRLALGALIGEDEPLPLVPATEVAFGAQGRFLYVPVHGFNELHVYDLERPRGPDLFQVLPTGQGPERAAAAPGGRSVAVVNREAGSVTIFDVNPVTGRLSERGTIDPSGAGVPFDGNNLQFFGGFRTLAVIANRNTDMIYTIDVEDLMQPADAQPTGQGPTQVTVSQFTIHVAAVCQGGDVISVFDIGLNDGLMMNPQTWTPPLGVTIGPGNGLGWLGGRDAVLTASDDNLYCIDTLNIMSNTVSTPAPMNARIPAVFGFSPPRLLVPGETDLQLYFYQGNLNPPNVTPLTSITLPGLPGQVFTPQNNFVHNFRIGVGGISAGFIARSGDPSGDVFVLDLINDALVPIDAQPLGPDPGQVIFSTDGRRLAVVAATSVGVFEIKAMDAELYPRGEFAPAGADFVGETMPALSGDGALGFVVDTASDTLMAFDALSTIVTSTPITDTLVAQESFGVSAARDAPRIAVTAGFPQNQISFFSYEPDTGALTPTGNFGTDGAIDETVLAEWRRDGSLAYIPVSGENSVRSVDPTGAVMDSQSTGGPAAHAALSPDGMHLFASSVGPPELALFMTDASGALIPAATPFVSPFPFWTEDNRPVVGPGFGDVPRAYLGAIENDEILMMGVREGGSAVEIIDTDDDGPHMPGGTAISEDGGVLAAVNTGDGTISIYEVVREPGEIEPTEFLSLRGSTSVFSPLETFNNPLLSPDGTLAFLGIADPMFGGVSVFDARDGASVAGFFSSAGISVVGGIALSGDGRILLATETEGLAGDRIHLIGVAEGIPPRMIGATLLERVPPRDGIGIEGDILALLFDQPMDLFTDLYNPCVDFGGFDITPGDIGCPVMLELAPFNDSVLLVTLGPGANSVDANSVYPAMTSTTVDIGGDSQQFLFVSAINGMPPLNAFSPLGVDLRREIPTISTLIDPLAGGVVPIPPNPDPTAPEYTFDGHRLVIPGGSLSQETLFTLGPPPSNLLPLGITSALTVTAEATGGGPLSDPLFDPPAFLVMQYDPNEVSRKGGQTESQVRIFQIPPGGGPPVMLPGVQMIDTLAAVITAEINDLNPAGLSGGAVLTGPGTNTQVGIFATLPVNPVEERSLLIAPEGGPSAPGGPTTSPPALTGGAGSAYGLHRLEFPGFVETTLSDPNAVEVIIRTASLLERLAFGAGQGFPTQSAAIFTVETRSASGSLIPFDALVNLTVQFIERTADDETDTVAFTGERVERSQMRPVQDVEPGSAVNFVLTSPTATVDTAAQTVTVAGLTPLTGSDGKGIIGAVGDPDAPVGETLSVDQLVMYLLGQITLTPGQLALANPNGDSVIDVADVVSLINAGP